MIEILQLNTIKENNIKICDYEWNWYYKRILKPEDDSSTNYWNIFVKDPNSKDYRVIPGVLSSEYSILKTEDAVAAIQKTLGGDLLTKPRVYRYGNSVCTTFILKEFTKIEVEEDDVTNKILFALLTDISPDSLIQKQALSFNLVNCMTGGRQVTLSYGLLTNWFPDNKSIKPLSINNIYVLGEFTNNLIHNHKLAVNYHDISNIQSKISGRLKLYKDTTIDDTFLNDFYKTKFPKRSLKLFQSYWEKLNDEHKNLYYATMIISAVASQNKNIDFEIRSRNYIADYVIAVENPKSAASKAA